MSKINGYEYYFICFCTINQQFLKMSNFVLLLTAEFTKAFKKEQFITFFTKNILKFANISNYEFSLSVLIIHSNFFPVA